MQFNSNIFHGKNIRLDRYLRQIYPYLTQGAIEKALRARQIKVNNTKVASNFRLKENDEVLVSNYLITPQAPSKTQTFSQSVIKLADKILNEYLLYDDKNFIAIDKPAKLPTQGGSKINISVDGAISYINHQYNYNFKLVHRIDKDTSGVLLIAKNYEAATVLAQAFKDKIISKTYLAIVAGKPQQKPGQEYSRISSYIIKSATNDFQLVIEDPINGKLAITDYKILKILNSNLTLVEFKPVTGRMHQLRVHAKQLGYPILGDKKYGNLAKKSDYMFLHAHVISLPKEIFGKEITIKSELPNYFTFATLKAK